MWLECFSALCDWFFFLSFSLQAAIVQGVMVAHSEEDLLCIRAAYLKLTGTSLYTALQASHAQRRLLKYMYVLSCYCILKHVFKVSFPSLPPIETVQGRSPSSSAGHLSRRRLKGSCKMDMFVNSAALSFFSAFCVGLLCRNKPHCVAPFRLIHSFPIQHVRQWFHKTRRTCWSNRL